MDTIYYWLGFAVFWTAAVGAVGFGLIVGWLMIQGWSGLQ